MKTTKEKLEDVILKLQENAESENYHSAIRMYREIANSVVKHGGEVVALKVMLDISKRGGFLF